MATAKHPLRTAIIGLSASAVTSWASNAHLPALLSPRGRELFTITALCNSSKSAAEAAIKHYNLPSSTKAYGDPESLAADPDIDVVICNTRVDKHFETSLASVKAGKLVYIEWPTASNLEQVETIVDAAKASGSKVAVGLHGRWAPPVVKIKEILESGEYGKLLSVETRAYGGAIDRASVSSGLAYFADRKVGGNPVTIGFSHFIDFIQAAVGELEPSASHALMQNQRPSIRIRHSQEDPSKQDETIPKDVPDLITLHGTLPETAHVAKGASISAFFRTGQPFKGNPSLSWSLVLERAEVLLSSHAGAMLQVNVYDPIPPQIVVHEYATDEVKAIPFQFTEEQKALPKSAAMVLTCLVALATGDESRYVSLESARRRAKQVEGWWNTE
ncbi:MAG: hypothetical protein Q9162_005759 [Coniocarpon cinnabarinum]